MKQILYIWLKHLLLLTSIFYVNYIEAQNKAPFCTYYQTNITKSQNITLKHSDTISLIGIGEIYALSIDAVISQPREDSFTRIVLEDTNGQDYLVAESNWFRNDTITVNLSSYCEETSKLDKIVPKKLKCFVKGDASILLKSIHFSLSKKVSLSFKNHILSPIFSRTDDIKKAQVQEIVNNINKYNIKHKKLWRAGVTQKALDSYHNQKNSSFVSDGNDVYLSNMKYYVEGIYEVGVLEGADYRTQQRNNEEGNNWYFQQSSVFSAFDWRNQHGKNWITPVKDQGTTSFCTVFGSIGALEAVTNLYFNQLLNLDLSEQDVAFYAPIDTNGAYYISEPLIYIKNNGVIDEATIPFQNTSTPNLPTTRPLGEENVRFSDFDSIFVMRGAINTEDSVKEIIRTKGPAVSAISTRYEFHTMTLIGYGLVGAWSPPGTYQEAGSYLQETGWIYPNDPRVGMTYWTFKNSYANDSSKPDYIDILFLDYGYMDPVYYFNGPILRRGHTDSEIVCEDSDGDGYYFWGISETPPSTLPNWAPNVPDGDDANYAHGPLNDYGFYEDIDPVDYDTLVYRTTNPLLPTSTIREDQYIKQHMLVKNGHALYIEADVLCNKYVSLTIESGARLYVRGTLRNAIIKAMPGSHIIIELGGKIIHSKVTPFEIPLGSILDITDGSLQ